MTSSSTGASTLVVIPAFGSPELTDAVVNDLCRDGSDLDPAVRIVVVDNAGDYVLPQGRISVHRPGRNLRWIGAANWALETSTRDGHDVCVVLNNDIRLSPGFLDGLLAPFSTANDIALAAACYDDFWLHQRAHKIPPTAAEYAPRDVLRDVDFCDGTAIAFAVAPVVELGGLDEETFTRHGYGADIDLAIRVRAAGLRCVVTEGAYVSHLRRQTMNRTGQTSEDNRAEILNGLNTKWGDGWRADVGLGPDSFPAHNVGSGASWYLTPPAG
ncbi:glycosyltransferase [Pseudarthrobacter sp. PS3-L1]|uniref:glycosyltransferase n=1 Tax=Pseudarthrobacter sp. PS3-L1 TaxID=3046207 RepID=UPI0024B8D6A9|nr:glycosyltransferase [Pseudarthrobacter sp. PS3-L1]MDJ0320499.1 glycosyltransferase [Pseudarthrobacter sp. PS3-L1]